MNITWTDITRHGKIQNCFSWPKTYKPMSSFCSMFERLLQTELDNPGNWFLHSFCKQLRTDSFCCFWDGFCNEKRLHQTTKKCKQMQKQLMQSSSNDLQTLAMLCSATFLKSKIQNPGRQRQLLPADRVEPRDVMPILHPAASHCRWNRCNLRPYSACRFTALLEKVESGQANASGRPLGIEWNQAQSTLRLLHHWPNRHSRRELFFPVQRLLAFAQVVLHAR